MNKQLLNYVNLSDKRVVLLQSGGLDSCILAHFLAWSGFKVYNLFIDYNQTALEKEWETAQQLTKSLNQKIIKAQIRVPWFDNEIMNGGVVTSNGYDNYNNGVQDSQTYVPLRNHLFISLAGTLAEKKRIPYICSGIAGAQDILGRPKNGFTDSHKKFADKICDSLNEGSEMYHHLHHPFTLLTPFVGMKKEEIIYLGREISADMSLSWTCYNKGPIPCGKCSACICRQIGFLNNEIPDPLLEYLSKPIDK